MGSGYLTHSGSGDRRVIRAGTIFSRMRRERQRESLRKKGGGRRAEAGGRRAEGGGRRAEGGGRRPEGGGRRAVGGGRWAVGGERRAEGRRRGWSLSLAQHASAVRVDELLSLRAARCRSQASASSGAISIGLSVAKSKSLNLNRSSRPFVKRIEWRNSLPRPVRINSTSSYCHSR